MSDKAPLVLVVEDMMNLRQIAMHYLQNEGFEVIGAEDGIVALEILRAEPRPDLVVLDLNMPRLDGYGVLKVMQAEKIPVPVLMLTARSEHEDLKKSLELGASGYMVKPFRRAQLIERAREILEAADESA